MQEEQNAGASASAAFADLLVEFVESATHQILHQREVYPQRIFERYGISY